MAEAYLWIKAGHIVAMTAWMAGLFYLPRLFVYHCDTAPGSQTSELFKVMEARLLRIIMMPAMAATWLFGLMLLHMLGSLPVWMILKLLCVLALTGFHLWLWLIAGRLARDERPYGSRVFRMVNELPTLLLIAIVVFVVVKPLG